MWQFLKKFLLKKKNKNNSIFNGKEIQCIINCYSNGNKEIERWFKNEKLHRKDGPAHICYYKNGTKRFEIYYDENELRHRENGPAFIYYRKNMILEEGYWLNGLLHRKNGPAIIVYNENGRILREEYWVNGIKIKEKGKEWVLNADILNSMSNSNNGINKDAFVKIGNEKYIDVYGKEVLDKFTIYDDNNIKKEEFFFNKDNRLHRNDGPAYINYYNDGTINYSNGYENGWLWFGERGDNYKRRYLDLYPDFHPKYW